MTAPRHRGAHTAPSAPWGAVRVVRRALSARAVGTAVAVAVVVMGVLLALRVLSASGADAPAERFTGVVTEFADDGAMVCVRRGDAGGPSFCDVYYVRPDTPSIGVGDRVVVTTIATRGEDGEPVSGMLVAPLP